MSQHVLNAGLREPSGKGALNSLRREGKIPAVIYNRQGGSIALTLDAKEFGKAVKGVSESTIVKLVVGKDSYECTIKDRQLNWLRGTIEHVDFYEIQRGVAMRAKVPVHLNGTPAGVREGGILEHPVHEIEVECMPKDMPERFELDISELKANHSIHVRDIKRAEGVKILAPEDQVVVLVKYAKGEAPAAEAEAAPAAAAPAAATPAAK